MWRFLSGIPRALRQQIQYNVRGSPACIEEECKNKAETEEISVCQRHAPSITYTCRFSSSKHGNGRRQSQDNGPEHEKFDWKNLNTDFWAQLHQGRHCAIEAVGWGAAVVLGIHLSKLSHLRGDLAELAKGKRLCCTLLYKVAFSSPQQDGVSTQRNVLPANKKQKEKLQADTHQPINDEPNALDVVFSEFEDLCQRYSATGNNIAGLQHAAQNNMGAAAHHWGEASKLGSAKAQFNLGLCYESGIGVEKNISEAIKQYKLAGNSDHAEALYNLALIYLNHGEEGGKTTEKALRLMEKSAELGLRQAQTYMGVHYTEGEKQDIIKAVSYFKSAAAQKDPEAEYFMGICLEQGWGIDQNECKAAEYYKRSSDGEHDGAMYNLAVFHEFGLGGLPVNVETAIELYERSAEGGNDNATHSLQRLKALEATAEWERQEFAETISQQSIKDTPHLKSPASSPSLTQYVREHLDQLVTGTPQTDYLPWLHADGLATGRPFFTIGDIPPKTPLFTLEEPDDFTHYTGQDNSNLYSSPRGLQRPASLYDLQVACT